MLNDPCDSSDPDDSVYINSIRILIRGPGARPMERTLMALPMQWQVERPWML